MAEEKRHIPDPRAPSQRDDASPATPASTLRKLAEQQVAADEAQGLQELTPQAQRQMLHELQVHQLELEMQNEELRRAQVELETSRARYFELYDLAPIGYCTLSENGLILETNLAVSNQLGVARSALLKQPLTRFIFKEDQDTYYLHRKRLTETDARQVCELRMLRESAAPFWVRIESAAAQDAQGHSVIRTVMSDITERKQLEDERAALEAQNRQLQKAESLGRMARAISHHFNNLLHAVIGQLELALKKLPPDAGPVKNLQAVMQAAAKAATISDMARTYLGPSSAKQETLDLCDCCLVGLPMLEAAMPKNVTLETQLPSPGPVIKADADQLRQILTNLFTNAWEAVGDRQGTIGLTVKTVSVAEIPVANRFPVDWQPNANTYACLEISDTGCGIVRADIEKLFDPFFSSKFIGRGLGLPVVLGILRAHGGAVTVESEAVRGSTFRVYLPTLGQEVCIQEERLDEAPVLGGTGTILLVEDEAILREMTGEMLKHLGYSVLTAQDGIEAQEVFRQHQAEIDCVLCDLSMPRLDGWQTLAALRKLEPDLPVVLVSGYDEAEVKTAPHPDVPAIHLKKPYQLKPLNSVIRRARGQA